MGIGAGEKMWNFFYHRTIKNLGGITHHLVPQTELAEMAHPFYNQFARGGEGHLEVGKNVYYTIHQPVPHGAGAEALRLHAVFAVGWSAIGGRSINSRT